jgi:hypothetical protein
MLAIWIIVAGDPHGVRYVRLGRRPGADPQRKMDTMSNLLNRRKG